MDHYSSWDDRFGEKISGDISIETPVLICAQAGNVNTGSFDPIPEIISLTRDRPSWLHVDGAFGLWAEASTAHRSLVQGIELAHSVSVDCHKWLNVPYDCGIAFVRDAAAHRGAMTLHASYYVTAHSANATTVIGYRKLRAARAASRFMRPCGSLVARESTH